jgi:glutamine amidotransferase
MCRLVAWLGEPVDVEWLLYLQEQSLHRQSWAPLEQRHGTVNADGWGVGWYHRSLRSEPARYRTTRPMWTDASFRSMAGVLRSDCVLAAVRSATPPSPIDEVNTPPYTNGRWLFAHNGAVAGWSHGIGEALRRQVTERRASQLEGSTDSEVLFALALDALDAGASPEDALRSVIDDVGSSPDTRLTMLLTDGDRLAAARHGDTLGWTPCTTPHGVLVASEPPVPRDELGNDAAGWRDLRDTEVLVWDRAGLLGEEAPEP